MQEMPIKDTLMKHGGDLTAAIAHYGGTSATWLDLSTGINPWPWPVPAGLLDRVAERLPAQAEETALLAAAHAAYRVPAGTDIVAAAGTQALIQWLPYLAPPGDVAIATPTYGEHATAWASNGRRIVACERIDHLPEHVRHIVVVNPNNPDGRVLDLDTIERAGSLARERQGWVVVDEAFIDIEPERSAASLCTDLPVLVLRSFGKFYGLAGVRLGFAIGSPGIIQRVRQALGPWAVSGPAIAIGTAALRDEAWARQTRAILKAKARQLDGVLQAAGCGIVGGTDLYRLIRHADCRALHDRLARRHIWCRRFDWADDLLRFGLPGDDHDFDRLAAALA